jgi:hypothetical protein
LVFSISIKPVRARCGPSGTDFARNLFPTHDAVAGLNRPPHAAGKPGQHGELVFEQVRAHIADHFFAMVGVQLHRDGVAHGAGGDEQRGLFAGDFGGAAFQQVYGGVFAINIVANLGFEHRPAHLRRGLGDGVAAQVDHVRNS